METRGAQKSAQVIDSVLERAPSQKRFYAKVRRGGPNECWGWAGAKRQDGYGVYCYARSLTVPAHRVAWALHNEKNPGQAVICHSCDNPGCVNPHHLFAGTPAENSADMKAKGRAAVRSQVGDLNRAAKLTSNDAAIIKRLISEGYGNTEIAREFGVTHHAISAIRRGKAWTEA